MSWLVSFTQLVSLPVSECGTGNSITESILEASSPLLIAILFTVVVLRSTPCNSYLDKSTLGDQHSPTTVPPL